jgi:hypothetical protein
VSDAGLGAFPSARDMGRVTPVDQVPQSRG